MIELVTLGGLEVHFRGVRLELPFKAATLVVILAHTPRRAMSRAIIADWLWPDTSKRLHSLDQTMYVLRRQLGAHALEIRGGEIALDPTATSDYLRALESLRSGDVLGACERVRGEFLERVSISGSEGFEEWRDNQQAYLSSTLYKALVSSVKTRREMRSWREVTAVGIQGIRLFPTSWELRVAAVEGKLALGESIEAEQIYWEQDAHDVGTTHKSPTFEELVAAARLTPVPPQSDVISRESELKVLSNMIADAAQSQARIAVLRGNPGVGKSILAEAAGKLASARGAAVIAVKAHPTEQGIGYNLLAEIISQTKHLVPVKGLPMTFAEALAEILPEAADTVRQDDLPRLGGEAAQRRLLEAATHFLLQAASIQPLVLLLDDLQWADDATLEWLVFFARRIRHQKVLILATARPTPERNLIQEVESIEGAERLVVHEFNPREAEAFVRSRWPDRVDIPPIEHVFKATGGNALLIIEYLNAVRRKSLTASDSHAEHSYVHRELNRLRRECRALLKGLAVIGHPVAPEIAVSVTGLSSDVLENCGQELTYYCEGLGTKTLRLKHDVVQDMIYRSLSDEERAGLHLKAAEALRAASASPGEVAEHYRRAGDREEASRFALEAAANSELAHAFREAAYYLEMAGETAASDPERLKVRGRLAELLFRIGRFETAAPLLREQAQHHTTNTWVRLDWEWRYLRAAASAGISSFGEIARAASALADEASASGHTHAFYQALCIELLHGVIVEGSPEIAVTRLLEFARAHPLTEEGTGALRLAGQTVAMQVNAEEGVAHLIHAADWATQLRDPELEITCSQTLGDAHYLVGEFEAAQAAFHHALTRVERTGALLHKSRIDVALGCLLMELGQADRAHEHLTSAFESYYNPERFSPGGTMVNRAILAWIRGDYLDAFDKAEAARSVAVQNWMSQTAIAVRGLASLELGRTSAAAADADYLTANLADGFVSDVSLPCYLIARMAALRKREATVIPFIQKRLSDYRDRDYICRQRLQLALAEVLARSNPAEALSLCKATIANAEAKGLVALCQLAETVQRRVTRVSRRL